MLLHQFYQGVRKRMKLYPTERYGQAFYNHLYEVRKDLAIQIQNTDKDPFNVSDQAPGGISVAIHFVESHWNDTKPGDNK